VAMDWAVNTVMNWSHVMCDRSLMVDCMLDRMIDLGHGANMDHTSDLLMVTEVHVMRSSVNYVMSSVMSSMMVTSGAICCDAGDKEGGCDEDPHDDDGLLCVRSD